LEVVVVVGERDEARRGEREDPSKYQPQADIDQRSSGAALYNKRRERDRERGGYGDVNIVGVRVGKMKKRRNAKFGFGKSKLRQGKVDDVGEVR
jgi:hypothetical protein